MPREEEIPILITLLFESNSYYITPFISSQIQSNKIFNQEVLLIMLYAIPDSTKIFQRFLIIVSNPLFSEILVFSDNSS